VQRPKGRYPKSKSRTHVDPGSRLVNPARIYHLPQDRCLDSAELLRLEQAFRSWSEASSRQDVLASRKRIFLIFLIIRYTGARLNEVLALDLHRDLDGSGGVVRFGNAEVTGSGSHREVLIATELMSEIQAVLADPGCMEQEVWLLQVDAGHVRRKFYERSLECGFPQELGSPNAIRRARAIELMQNNVPLPVVQRILGHSTPNLTASLVSFSEEDIHQVARHFIQKESRRKTSARNTFFGKISLLQTGDIQARVELVTLGGDKVTTVITNNSVERLGLKVGSLVTAEIKAPWVIVQTAQAEPACTAENIFPGTVTHVIEGKLITEITVRIEDGTELCSVVTEQSRTRLKLNTNDRVWVMFNSFAVVLHVD
jgi:molybdate transport system regulatory protein